MPGEMGATGVIGRRSTRFEPDRASTTTPRSTTSSVSPCSGPRGDVAISCDARKLTSSLLNLFEQINDDDDDLSHRSL